MILVLSNASTFLTLTWPLPPYWTSNFRNQFIGFSVLEPSLLKLSMPIFPEPFLKRLLLPILLNIIVFSTICCPCAPVPLLSSPKHSKSLPATFQPTAGMNLLPPFLFLILTSKPSPSPLVPVLSSAPLSWSITGTTANLLIPKMLACPTTQTSSLNT